MNAWTLYLITAADSIVTATSIIGVIGGVATIIFWVVYKICEHEDDDFKLVARSIRNTLFTAALPCLLLAILVPSTKQLTAIIGVSYLTQVDQIGNLPPKAVKALNKLLNEYIKDEKPRTN